MAEPTWRWDLLESKLKNSGDPTKVAMYHQIMTYSKAVPCGGGRYLCAQDSSNKIPWSQHQSRYGSRKKQDKNCLPAARDFCAEWLGGFAPGYTRYYQAPPKGSNQYLPRNTWGKRKIDTKSVLFPVARIQRGIRMLNKYLMRGKPCLVGISRCEANIIHTAFAEYHKKGVINEKFLGNLQAFHWIAVVASSGTDTFLYLDPWDPQSYCEYKSEPRGMMGYLQYRQRFYRNGFGLICQRMKWIALKGP